MGYYFSPVTPTAGNSTATATAAWPAGHVSGDVAFLAVETSNQAVSLSTAAGFTLIDQTGQGTAVSANASRIAVYWCRATSSSMSSPVIADAGDHVNWVMHVVRGIDPSVTTPYDSYVLANKGTGSTTTTSGTLDTSANNALGRESTCMYFFGFNLSNNASGGSVSDGKPWIAWSSSTTSGDDGLVEAIMHRSSGVNSTTSTRTHSVSVTGSSLALVLPSTNNLVVTSIEPTDGNGQGFLTGGRTPSAMAVSSGTGAVTTAWAHTGTESGNIGDLGLLVVESSDSSVSLSSAQGFSTLLSTTGSTGTHPTYITVFSRVLTQPAALTTPPTIADPGDHIVAASLFSVSGGYTGVGTIQTTAGNVSSGSSVSLPSVSTSGFLSTTPTMVLHLVSCGNDSATFGANTANYMANASGAYGQTVIGYKGAIDGDGGSLFIGCEYWDGSSGSIGNSMNATVTSTFTRVSIPLFGVSLIVPKSSDDVGSGADSVSGSIGLAIGDVGSGADPKPVVTASDSKSDAAAGVDSASMAASVPVADVGVTAEDSYAVPDKVQVLDDFNRADGALTDPWINQCSNGRQYYVSGNQLVADDETTGYEIPDRYLYNQGLPSDHFVEWKVSRHQPDSGLISGAVLRADKWVPTSGIYIFELPDGMGAYVCTDPVGPTVPTGWGADSGLYPSGWPDGTRLRVEAEGDQLRLIVNGVLSETWDSPDPLPVGNFAGLSLWSDSASSNPPLLVDDFKAGDLSGVVFASGVDIGVGSDQVTNLVASTSAADAGAGTDTAGVTYAPQVVDASSPAVDSRVSLTAAVPASDTGSGTDTAQVTSKTANSSDSSGAAVDSAVVTATISVSDASGAATETAAATIAAPAFDQSGTAVEGVPKVGVQLSDTGSGNDSAQVTSKTLFVGDTASGTDVAIVSARILAPVTDSSAATDSLLSAGGMVTASDTGLGVDVVTSLVVRASDDGGSTADSVSSLIISLPQRTDAGTAVDSASVSIMVADSSVSAVDTALVFIEGIGLIAPRTYRPAAEPRVLAITRDPNVYQVPPEVRLRVLGREERTVKIAYSPRDPVREFEVEKE